MKHKIPAIDRRRWCGNPQDFLDLEFVSAPIINIENATATIILHQ